MTGVPAPGQAHLDRASDRDTVDGRAESTALARTRRLGRLPFLLKTFTVNMYAQARGDFSACGGGLERDLETE